MLNNILKYVQNRVAIFVIILIYHAAIGLAAGVLAYGALLLIDPKPSELKRNITIYGFLIFSCLGGVSSAIAYLKALEGHSISQDKIIFVIIGCLGVAIIPLLVLISFINGHAIDPKEWNTIGLLSAFMIPLGLGLIAYAKRK